MILAALTTERDWPWRDGDLLGGPGLFLIAALLVVLTLWTYSGQRAVGWRKVLTVLGLRLGALGVVVLLLLRPSFASEQEVVTPGRLIVVVDNSLSMKINDGPNSSTRWDFVRQLLDGPAVKEALERLQREKQIDIVYYQAAESVRRFDPAGDADGLRTDIGNWLKTLLKNHQNDRNLRGLVLLTDGADNGTSYPVLDEAARWRELPCPIHTFGVGSELTSRGQRNIAVVDVRAGKDVVYLKNTVPVKLTIDAPNLEGQKVTVRLFVDGKQVGVKDNVILPSTRGNVVDAGEFVADRVGEIKVTVKVDEVPGEITTLDNEMSTFINVRKEGVSILWVDQPLREEAVGILGALSKNARFSITFDPRTRDGFLTPAQAEFFKTPEKSFDVLIVGDIRARDFAGPGGDALFDQVASSVRGKHTGLLMLGGHQTFGNSDWHTLGKKLADLLPVELLPPGQVQEEVLVVPVEANKRNRLVQLGVPPTKDLWRDIFHALDGHVKLGKVKDGARTLLETAETREPILVIAPDEGPRAAAFAGDTTWAHANWSGNEEAVRAFERFWTQLVAWLARQEEGDNQVWVKLDKRRIAVGANLKLNFTVGADGKDGQPLRNARYTVKVQGPGGEFYDIATALKLGEERGAFGQASAAGEYKVIVSATASGPQGQEVSLGTASARFMGFAEDVENQQPAANHKDLIKLAAAGGGAFHIAGKEELLQYLQELRDRSTAPAWVKRDVWPNWKTLPASDAVGDQLGALLQSLALPCLVLFVMCLGMEWFLRRRWGLV